MQTRNARKCASGKREEMEKWSECERYFDRCWLKAIHYDCSCNIIRIWQSIFDTVVEKHRKCWPKHWFIYSILLSAARTASSSTLSSPTSALSSKEHFNFTATWSLPRQMHTLNHLIEIMQTKLSVRNDTHTKKPARGIREHEVKII